MELWVTENQMTLNEGPYVADIGFSVRKNASGGATLSPSAMKLFAELKITIYFSEYWSIGKSHNEIAMWTSANRRILQKPGTTL